MGKHKDKDIGTVPIFEMFGLPPDYSLTKKEKKLLKAVARTGAPEFHALCMELDLKPSALAKKTEKLMKYGLIAFTEAEGVYSLTAPAVRYLEQSKEERKNKKKFREFLQSMNGEEKKAFFRICDRFQYMEEAPDPEMCGEPENGLFTAEEE